MSWEGVWLRCAIIIWFFAGWPVNAGFYVSTISPGNVPWPGGTVPYVFDSALSAAQQQTYLNALREYELAANVHFIPRTSEAQYILFKYDPNGFDNFSGSNPQVVAVSSLTRAQICHEMGHSFGLLHEHTRGRYGSTYVNVLSANITSGNQHWFNVDPTGTAQGAYDFESVMHFGQYLFSTQPDPTQPNALATLQAKPGFEQFQPRMGGLALSKGAAQRRSCRTFPVYRAGPMLSPVVTNTSESGVRRSACGRWTMRSIIPARRSLSISRRAIRTMRMGCSQFGRRGISFPLVVDGTIIDGTITARLRRESADWR